MLNSKFVQSFLTHMEFLSTGSLLQSVTTLPLFEKEDVWRAAKFLNQQLEVALFKSHWDTLNDIFFKILALSVIYRSLSEGVFFNSFWQSHYMWSYISWLFLLCQFYLYLIWYSERCFYWVLLVFWLCIYWLYC